MSDDVILIDVRKTARSIGIGSDLPYNHPQNPWYGHSVEDVHNFSQRVIEIIRDNPNASEVHTIGLMPIEVAFCMGWIFGQAGLKAKYARSNCYLQDLPIPYGAYYESEELGFV